MQTSVLLTTALLALFSSQAFADVGDRIEQRLDNKGDRIEQRYVRLSTHAAANGNYPRAVRLIQKGERINTRLDNKGERINRRFERLQ